MNAARAPRSGMFQPACSDGCAAYGRVLPPGSHEVCD
jgi:hypothetical protein